jgi:hypothetical protein
MNQSKASAESESAAVEIDSNPIGVSVLILRELRQASVKRLCEVTAVRRCGFYPALMIRFTELKCRPDNPHFAMGCTAGEAAQWLLTASATHASVAAGRPCRSSWHHFDQTKAFEMNGAVFG